MHIKEFFYLQKSDRSVLTVLLVGAVFLLAAAFLLGDGQQTSTVAPADSVRQVAAENAPYDQAARRPTSFSHGNQSDYGREPLRAERFPFDPNTADSMQLLRLGLRPWQVRNLCKYRRAGGVFRQPTDFARLYGLTADEYRSLEPYIRIAGDHRPAAEVYATPPAPPASRDTLRRQDKLRPGEQIALNEADTALLKRVPGIGSYFARAIVDYGRRLGGYHSVLQLMEIKNFPESALDYFHAGSNTLRRLNLNRLSTEQLRSHPYLNYHQAKAITDYRRLHGPLQSLQDLSLLPDFPPEAIERLAPYVEF